MARLASPLLIVLVALVGLVGVACGDDGDGGSEGPTIHFVGAEPDDGDPPLEVDFGSSVTPGSFNASELTYEWDFGDGSTSSEKEPRHTYTEPGVYEAVTTATAPDGSSDSRSVTVTVTGLPPTTVDPPDDRGSGEEIGFDDWVMGANEACIEAAESVEEVRAQVTDPVGPEVVQASVEATRAEKAAIDELGVPTERVDEVEAWTVAHHSLADYFVDSAADDQISIEEATQLQQRSLELSAMSEPLGLTGCIGDGG